MNKQFELKKFVTEHGTTRFIAEPIGDNRQTRREKEVTGVRNNRSNPLKRDKVRVRMAHFSMAIGKLANEAAGRRLVCSL